MHEDQINEELQKNIEAVLNLFVRPVLAAHQGDLSICGLDEEGTLWIEMLGQCAGCPSADDTVKNLVKQEITSRIPEIKDVEIDSGISEDIMAEAMSLLTHRWGNKHTTQK